MRRLAASGELHAASLNHLIDQGPAPLVEPDTCTFFYRGAADAVRLVHWGVGLPPNLDFTRLAGTDLWYLVLELVRGSRRGVQAGGGRARGPPHHRGPPQPAQGPQPLRRQLGVPGVRLRDAQLGRARPPRGRRHAEGPRADQRRLRSARPHHAVPAARVRRRVGRPAPAARRPRRGRLPPLRPAEDRARQPHPSGPRARRWWPPSAILANGWPSTPTTLATPSS